MAKSSDKRIIETEEIRVFGARVHNLKNIDLSIPRNQLTVVTGLSGSGKSSLAFDTIYAEGQRRYMETLSAYARQFLGNMERPDVDKITGLSPVIAIEQKTTGKNPRSTVGTITEIYDFLRLLYARAGIAYSYNTGEPMVKYTDDQIINLILENYTGQKVYLLAPIVKGRKGHYKDVFEQIRRKGFLNARVDGELIEIRHGLKLDRYKTHFIEIVIDKMEVDSNDKERLKKSVNLAMQQGKGVMMLLDVEKKTPRFYSRLLMCPTTGISYNEPAPHTFSFNSPQGACPHCNGLGTINRIDISKVIPDPELSIKKGGILPLGPYKNILIFWQLEAVGAKYKFNLSTPIKDIPEDGMNVLLYGAEETFKLENTPLGFSTNYFLSFEGVINYIANHLGNNDEEKWTDQYIEKVTCPDCAGTRLKKESLHFLIHDKNIAQLAALDVSELYSWLGTVSQYLNPKQLAIASEILKELKTRVHFLLNVGLDYLSLNRSAGSLSGGESQRIRLATQIGSQLVNVLYILDEPSIGLHQRDNQKLIESLKELRDTGNSVIVVEHDRQMILNADYVVDLGPFAGRHGGEVCAAGTPGQIMKTESLTALYLNHKKEIEIPKQHRAGNGKKLILKGATGNNLRNVDIELPLGKFICITGVSGSGKSTAIYDTLFPILSKHFYKSSLTPLPYQEIKGLEFIDKVIEVDQAPLGRTPRSNPATYTGVFSDIRKLFEQTRESKIRGYKAGRFSFNVKGGRCETCQGAGLQTIEMNFLPDVYVQCNVCNGRRYNRETLEVRYKGKNISEVLDMTISQAVEFFEGIPPIRHKLSTIDDVGLGYVTLGQPSTTLSGGESQRIKLAAELSRKDTGKTLYILDEPTTGLHFEDVRVLLQVLDHLADKGNTIVVIEHNLDVIKVADHIIDMGPEGGIHGGEVICTGTPEEVVMNKRSYTAVYLKEEMEEQEKAKTKG